MVPRNTLRKDGANRRMNDHDQKAGLGLNVEIHPALLSDNVNLIRHKDNPYLSSERSGTNTSKIEKRYIRGLKFAEPGVLSKKIAEQRAQRAQEVKLRQQHEEIKKAKIIAGELPDESIGEQNYLLSSVPEVEWWDTAYLQNLDTWKVREKYLQELESSEESEDDIDENESERQDPPSLRYVQHPVPVKEAPDGQIKQPKIYLVKREQEKIRRNRRKLLREEHEERIRIGLEPKPQPKVKLSNMMSVYQNTENITDPTSWEQTVKSQVEERHRKHVETNIRRHLDAQERKQALKVHGSDSLKRDVASEWHCKVFRFSSLRNPKIRYRLTTNSRQLKLSGACLRVGEQGPGILVVIGSEKNCRFYSKLVLQRIKWSESFVDSRSGVEVDCNGDAVGLAWEGTLRQSKFRGWFMKACESTEEMRKILLDNEAEWLFQLFDS
ncbi:LADA_0G07272g1_1 [Lachancea dasiensis]|uniref:LADA_0G07272g1_1 n=1 Tax=Lachancea dasiensis TaxID=1072105 RepID=A0A1G4JTP4_9SACH|nr:LADA_0G07272g1_1 [Lachancea dasiensis]